jgi:hypothetical protein
MDNSKPPSPPSMMLAIFTNDLGSIQIKFNSATNRGNHKLSVSFKCYNLFGFMGANVLDCRWFDDDLVLINLAASFYLSVGNSISLLENKIKAKCNLIPIDGCLNWSSSFAQTIKVSPPPNPVTPIVQINAPDTIGECSNYTIDWSASSGSGGRPWAPYYSVVSSLNDTNILSLYLNNTLSFQNMITIPHNLLFPGIYSFILKLCNFFYMCSTSQKTFLVIALSIPKINIVGSSNRILRKSEELVLAIQSSSSSCSNISRNTYLDYSWVTTENGIFIGNIKSVSRQADIFKVPSHSFNVDKSYLITVTVTDMISLSSSYAYVSISVVRSNLKAISNHP